MPRYYFHLREGADLLSDLDGEQLADMPAMRRHALVQARDVMAGDVRSGALDLRLTIEVTDAGGSIVHALRFADAVQIQAPPVPLGR